MGVGTGGVVDMCTATGEVVRAWRMGKGNKGVVRASVRWGRVHLTAFPKAVLGTLCALESYGALPKLRDCADERILLDRWA